MSRKRNTNTEDSNSDTNLGDTVIESSTECIATPNNPESVSSDGEEPKVTENPLNADPLQPVSLELLYGDKANTPPEKLTKEKVEASVRKKLAKKTDEEMLDPFVPQAQLDNEVIQVAREQGFHLSRGTEVGARLIARSRRKN